MHGTWEICSKVAIFRGETKRESEINTLRFQFQHQKLINLRYQFMELKNSTALRFMHRPRLIYLTISIFFLSICALLTSISSTRTACLDIKCSLNADGDLYFQRTLIDKTLNNSEQKRTIQTNRGVPFSLARRYLSGPGSSPPRCTSKCGKCTPCKPVHVAVPPGTPVTTEYYPEAWRCKCGNKLYMP